MTFPNYYQYQPYQSYFQPYQQNQNSQNTIIWVSGETEAQSYPVAPNNAVAMWDSTSPVIYLKQADASGKPTTKTYDLVEHKATGPKTAPISDFATKADIVTLQEEIEALKRRFTKPQKGKENTNE